MAETGGAARAIGLGSWRVIGARTPLPAAASLLLAALAFAAPAEGQTAREQVLLQATAVSHLAGPNKGMGKGDKGGMFQPVDGGVNRVCRGANFTDDATENYVLHKGTASLGECMRLCIEAPVCKGIEFNARYNGGHCEVWTLATGINATAPVRGFMCLRYGAVAEKFDLIHGASSNRVCRGDSPDDNSEAYYTLHTNVPSLRACKDLCAAEPECRGIEHNQAQQGGRCEVWTRTAGISATLPVPGFTCLRYGTQEHFKPVDGGEDRVCRGAGPVDNSRGYYVLHNDTASLDDCKKLCMEAPVCKGIEYNPSREGGRCEVWTRSAGISATAPGRGFTCLMYGTVAEQFALADGGENRACRGAGAEDNSPVYYVLHVNTSTLSACKELCIHAPICKGIEYNPSYDGGRCEIWTRTGGIGATTQQPGSSCLRYGSSAERFEPVDGGEDRVCRGATPGDDSPGYYELHSEVGSLSECRALCINSPVCRGVEYIAERLRCEVWTRADGVGATSPKSGSACLRYGPAAQFDLMDGGAGRACRGASARDDSDSYYVLHTGTASLADCQALCLRTQGCKGVEYSSEYDNGRCEVWTRPGGISASAPMSGSLCLSYGEAEERQFHPMDGGVNRVCRGADLDDNAPNNYILHTGTPSLGACKALCVDTPGCRGVEYSEAYDSGRCEVWTAKGGIMATKPKNGTTCLSYGAIKGQFEVLDGGLGRVCRGAGPKDDSASYYVLHTGISSLEACKELCVEAPICKGVEYHAEENGGRCEVWTRLGGIRATAAGAGSVCYRYGTSEPFLSVDGGEGRACRGESGLDDSPGYYVLHKGVASLDSCKRLCESAAVCKGVEYNRDYDHGRCEVWTRAGGIAATAAMRGSECLRYGAEELFWPAGGVDQACRGASEKDDSPAYYLLHLNTSSLDQCKSLCVHTPHCRGVEFSEKIEGGRCEVWTRVGGIRATHPANGTSCFRYGELPMDAGLEVAAAKGPGASAGATRASRRRRRASPSDAAQATAN